jgi:hypothetical protein
VHHQQLHLQQQCSAAASLAAGTPAAPAPVAAGAPHLAQSWTVTKQFGRVRWERLVPWGTGSSACLPTGEAMAHPGESSRQGSTASASILHGKDGH